MATLVLGAAGNAILPGVGGIIGAGIGSIFDNYAISWLFPPKPLEGQRLDGLALSSGNEGTAMNWFLGPQPPRLPGVYIYLSELIPTKNTTKVGKGGPGQKVSNYTYAVNCAVAWGDTQPQGVSRLRRIWGNVKTLWHDGDTTYYDSVTHYDGTQTTPDPFLESIFGVGNTPIFKGQAYSVFQNLQLADFGNTVPLMGAYWEQEPDCSVAEAIEWIAERASLNPNTDIDVTRVSSCFRGLNAAGSQSSSSLLEALFITYGITMRDDGTKLVFYDKQGADVVNASYAEIGDPSQTGILKRLQEAWRTPQRIDLSYSSVELELQPGSARASDDSRASTTTEPTEPPGININVPLTLSDIEADAVARRILWTAYNERREATFYLPAKYQYLKGGDILRLAASGSYPQINVFCKSVSRGTNYKILVQGHIIDTGAYSQTGIPGGGGYSSGAVYYPPNLDVIFMDVPALTEENVTNAALHYVATTDPVGETFKGASLFASQDGTNYAEVNSLSQATPDVGTIIAAPTQGSNLVWDEDSTIDVQMINGTLESSSDALVMAGQANIAAIQANNGEWEIIGFVTVTALGEGMYRLSRLLRGLRGTENYSGHIVGSRPFVLLDPSPSIGIWNAGLNYISSQLYLKLVAEGDTLSNVNPRKIAFRGRCLTPLAPALGRWRQDSIYSTNGQWDVHLSWHRRTRYLIDAFATSNPLPPDESPEKYLVEIRRGGALTTLLRQVEVDTPYFDYTYAMRLEDEALVNYVWTYDAPFWAHIRQKSNVVGAGYPLTIQVIYP